MKHRCVLVMSIGRSGSSCVAGMLHKMGVWMGDEFFPSDRNNRYGTYENLQWFDMNRAVLNGAYHGAYARLVPDNKPLWGLKDPLMDSLMPTILPYLDDTRVIEVRREREATIASYVKAYRDMPPGRDEKFAQSWYDGHKLSLCQSLKDYDGPVLDVQFERVKAHPIKEARRIAEFVFEDMYEEVTAGQIMSAAEHVNQGS